MKRILPVIVVLALIVALIVSAIPVGAAFSGANGQIVFVSYRTDVNGDIYKMNADGTDQTRLTANWWQEGHPAWSPDGRKVAYEGFHGASRDIYVMNADGTDQTQLTNSQGHDNYPAWSPDGSKIAFESLRDGNFEIYVMNADGTGQTRLTNNTYTDREAAWSPDGSKIAFFSNRDEITGEIYVMNADGTNQTRLTSTPGLDLGPNWSPDGSQIVFSSARDGHWQIYVMNADGTSQTRLTDNSSGDQHPVWSPDGTKITFDSTRDGNSEIYVMNADGTGQTRLTNNDAEDHTPNWQPIVATVASTTPAALSEAVANDGSLTSGEVTLTIANGTLAADVAKADVTASNLPAGLDYTVTRTSDTELTINITGNATNHANANDVSNLTFTIAKARVTGATVNPTSANISINFNDPAPVAPASAAISGPASGDTCVAYTFDASVTPGDVTTPLTYTWSATDFANVIHTDGGITDSVVYYWETPGTKTVSLTVGNACGVVTTSHTIEVSIPWIAPESVEVSGPSYGAINEAYTFDASVLFDIYVKDNSDCGLETPITYTWEATDLADVIHTDGGATDSAGFTWTTPGAKTIEVTATNGGGSVTNTHTIDISVLPPADNVAVTGPTTGTTGIEYTFNVTVEGQELGATADASLPITYTWSATGLPQVTHTKGLSDADPMTDSASFTFPTAGEKTVSVLAQNAGGEAVGTTTIMISAPPPPPEVPEPGTIMLLASGLAGLGGLTAFRNRFRR